MIIGKMQKNAMIWIRKLDLDPACLRVYEQRGRYLKLFQYLYPMSCMSPDVTDILCRMQNILVQSLQLVGKVITCVNYFVATLLCVPFCPCKIRHFVVVYDKSYWS